MSKTELKSVRGWLKNVRKFATGTKYGYHPSLDFPTICIQKYLQEIDGFTINDPAYVTIDGTQIEIGNFFRELRRDNVKSKQRLDVIGHGHENLNSYLKEATTPSTRTLKNLIAVMTDEIQANIAEVNSEIKQTLQKAE